MQIKKNNRVPLPEWGLVQKLSTQLGCSTKTVYNALRRNMTGKTCEIVRETYYNEYVKPYLKSNYVHETICC